VVILIAMVAGGGKMLVLPPRGCSRPAAGGLHRGSSPKPARREAAKREADAIGNAIVQTPSATLIGTVMAGTRASALARQPSRRYRLIDRHRLGSGALGQAHRGFAECLRTSIPDGLGLAGEPMSPSGQADDWQFLYCDNAKQATTSDLTTSPSTGKPITSLREDS